MNLPKYPEYVESGVEWLGRAPMHWASAPLKVIATCNDEVLPESTASNRHLNYVEISDVSSSEGLKTYTSMRFSDAPSRARRVVRCGDILISTVRTYLKAITSIQGNAEDFIASTGFAVIRPKNNYIISNYLSKVVLAGGFIGEIISRSVGVSYPAINASDIMNLKVPLPPQIEQIKIAQFLDYETAKIDALIDEQKRLIELLKEKRQAVISHAVTKGLNPDAPMKDSGVEWLGDVPEHWRVAPLKWFTTIRGGIAMGKRYEANEELVECPYLRVANVQSGHFDLSEIKTVKVTHSEANKYRLKSGEVLMNEGGDNDKLGRGAIWKDDIPDCLHQNHVFAINIERDLLPEWLATFTESSSARAYFYLYSKQSTNLASISSSNVISCLLPIPPKDEQEFILYKLALEVDAIDDLHNESIKMMETLKERRSALISAAVTGKIDVRDWQPPEDADLIDSNAAVQMERQDG